MELFVSIRRCVPNHLVYGNWIFWQVLPFAVEQNLYGLATPTAPYLCRLEIWHDEIVLQKFVRILNNVSRMLKRGDFSSTFGKWRCHLICCWRTTRTTPSDCYSVNDGRDENISVNCVYHKMPTCLDHRRSVQCCHEPISISSIDLWNRNFRVLLHPPCLKIQVHRCDNYRLPK